MEINVAFQRARRITFVLELIQTLAQYNGHDPEHLNQGLIELATLPQVGFLAGLLWKCGMPKDRQVRLNLIGRVVRRKLRSSKDLSRAEASAFLDWLLVGSDGLGTSETEPCGEAKEIIGLILLDQGVALVERKEREHDEYQQLGFC